MDKYSIVSVVNGGYEKFAKVFLRSAIEKLNLEMLHEICILDTGLKNDIVEELSNIIQK